MSCPAARGRRTLSVRAQQGSSRRPGTCRACRLDRQAFDKDIKGVPALEPIGIGACSGHQGPTRKWLAAG